MIDAPPSGLTGRSVLVVEDEYFIADDLTRLLKENGAEVVGPLSEVSEALHQLSLGERIDVAVLDLNLRGEMAYSVAESLQQRDIPFVFATGYATAWLPIAFAEIPRFEKPYEFTGLLRTLPSLIRRDIVGDTTPHG